jgi:conjugal transfer mating pair stabilization protein TraG
MRHDQNSQAVNDFRQGMDMVTSSRVSDGSNHTENAANSNVQQFAATLNDAQSQYHQYTTSSTQSNEFSRMATMAQNQSASLDTNYNQEFVDWAANKYGDKAQSMLTSAPTAREAAMEFVNERLKPEISGDYQQARSDLASGTEHAAFSGEHIVHSGSGGQQDSGSVRNDDGVRYSSANSETERTAAIRSGSSSGNHQVTEESSLPAGRGISTGQETTGSVHTESGQTYRGEQSTIAERRVVSQPGTSYRDENIPDSSVEYTRQDANHSGLSREHEAVTIQKTGTGNNASSASGIEHGRHSAAAEHTGSAGTSHRTFSHSGQELESQTIQHSGSRMTETGTPGAVDGNRVSGSTMQDAFEENQSKLHEQSGRSFEPQNDIQRRVAEQRSENEHKINESAGEIGKKQSTVQTSSDILKGESLNANSTFQIHRKEAEIDQQMPVVDGEEKENLKVNCWN